MCVSAPTCTCGSRPRPARVYVHRCEWTRPRLPPDPTLPRGTRRPHPSRPPRCRAWTLDSTTGQKELRGRRGGGDAAEPRPVSSLLSPRGPRRLSARVRGSSRGSPRGAASFEPASINVHGPPTALLAPPLRRPRSGRRGAPPTRREAPAARGPRDSAVRADFPEPRLSRPYRVPCRPAPRSRSALLKETPARWLRTSSE